MKILLNTTEDWKEISQAVTDAEDYLARFDINITLNKIDFDVSKEEIYETLPSWDWLKLKFTKSIKALVIYVLGESNKINDEFDVYGLVCDKKKALEDTSLYGQHTKYNGKHCIEIYAKKTTKKYWGFKYTSYNLIHELLHAIALDLGKKDTLHEYLKDNKNLDAYLDYLKPEPAEITEDLLPLVKKKMEALFILAKVIGLDLRMTSGYRSFAEQDELYAQGRTKPGNIVTNAKGGESLHNYGVAFDIVDRKKGYNLSDNQWKALGIFWKRLGGEWGGDWTGIGFSDKPHFQYTMGYSLKDFQLGKVDYTKYN